MLPLLEAYKERKRTANSLTESPFSQYSFISIGIIFKRFPPLRSLSHVNFEHNR